MIANQEMAGVFTSRTLAAAASVVLSATGATVPCTVTAVPQSGDTLTVSYSTDQGVTYQTWTAGTVSSATAVVFDFPVTHFKFECAGSGTSSVVTIC